MITFRETLEAALIVGIVLAFLRKTKNTSYNPYVYSGVAAGVAASAVAALMFNVILGGFEGRAEELFEGILMIFGAFLLTTVILWMMRQKHRAQQLRDNLSEKVMTGSRAGIFLLVFTSILREGVETVIFLGTAGLVSTGGRLVSGILGAATAVLLGYLIFRTSMRFNIKAFFNVSSALLLLFAAGLMAHGVHELGEASVIPVGIENLWDINPPAPLAEQGIYPLLHDKGHIGSVLAGLFGYNGNPSLAEVLAYVAYLASIAFVYRRVGSQAEADAKPASARQ